MSLVPEDLWTPNLPLVPWDTRLLTHACTPQAKVWPQAWEPEQVLVPQG